MFKGLAGLKKVVKGGISAVAEHSSDLAEKVISDPSTSQGHLKENLKKKVQDVVASGEQISTDTHAKEKADEVAKVVNKVRHYGALGEDYLGYDDPTKDLRKAVKAKEKAAKKARKAKKKKTGKKEDLFDPENLAKFKAELEERKRREAEFLQEQEEEAVAEAAAGAVAKESGDEHSQNPSDHEETEVKFTLDLAPGSEQSSRGHSAAPTPKLKSPLTPIRAKEDTDDWKLFQSLTSGVDAVIKKKKEELEDIKQVSYFQKKAQPADDHSDDSPTQGQPKDGKKKKKWVDLDKAGFDDIDGSISGTDDEDASAHEGPVKDAPEAEENSEEDKEEDIGLVEIPDDEPLSDEEDIFNTGFVDAITSGEVKLAVIPDDPVYDDKDDPFNTNYADEIVQKDKVEKRKEANRIKFTGLSSVADVLSGKADKVDKSLIEHSTKRKRRRANRINLIGGENTELTAIEDIGFIDPNKPEASQQDILTDVNEDPPAKKDLLESTSSPLPPSPAALCSDEQKDTPLIDVSEFEVLKDEKEVHLTSNVAILAGEFSAPLQEEEDDFDAAFDALAQESVTRGKLEDLERQFEDTDVFDTTCADTVLNLASLTNKVEEIEEPLETFEDKDPFDTSAYEDITGDLEADLDFDTLAKRDPDQDFKTTKKADIDDEFKGWSEVQPAEDQGWSAFQETEKKPSRPPPPRPAPPRPSRAPAPSKVHLHPLSAKDAPSVVIKAPSTESIKSWNCTTADILIKKSEIEALNDPSLEEEEEEEDPFDTSNFNEIVDKDNDEEDIEDPFDTSGFKSPEPEPEPQSEAEEEAVPDPKPREEPDLLGSNNEGDEDIPIAPITPAAAAEADPFDTEFASGVLPDKGDPFDTSYVKGGPGKAEIKALEEEFLTQEEFDPRTEEGGGTQTSSRKVYPGLAGRARPKRGQQSELQQVKAPTPEEEEEDPFDTTIVDKVIPVRQATKNSEISVEDENFDPTSTFDNCKEEVDPFDTTIASQVIPELAGEEKAKEEPSTPPPPEVEEVKEEVEEVPQEPEPPKPDESYKAFAAKDKPVDEIAKKIGRARPRKPLARQLTDEEFDPRA